MPDYPFRWTNHSLLGGDDLPEVYRDLWDTLLTSKIVRALWPNDPDGIAFADPVNGFPPALANRGFALIDAGRYQNLKDDFSAEIVPVQERGGRDRHRRDAAAGSRHLGEIMQIAPSTNAPDQIFGEACALAERVRATGGVLKA